MPQNAGLLRVYITKEAYPPWDSKHRVGERKSATRCAKNM
nr:MAG TPA: hypothetical protein [Caudoviricetes sp.]